MVITRADGDGWRGANVPRRLTVRVVAPTGDRAIGKERARVLRTCTDGGGYIDADITRGLAVRVVAPAGNGATGKKHAGMVEAGADRSHRDFVVSSRLAVRVVAPTGDRAIGEERTSVLIPCTDGGGGLNLGDGLRRRGAKGKG